MIHNMIGGGGGTALNFQVTGNPQPANPKENTVWVDTDTEITGWCFSAAQPDGAEEGMVWIKTDSAGTTEFNALKKNGIMVCPVGAKQYAGGVWVDKDAQIYQDGAWKSWWTGQLYAYGDECKAVTGGWVTDQVSFISEVTAVDPRITLGGDGVTIDIAQSGPYGGIYRTKNKIPFAGKNTLVFTGSARGDNTERCAIMVWSEMNRDFEVGRVAMCPFDSDFSGDAVLDISDLQGNYYVGIHVYAGSLAQVTMQQMKLS